MPPLTDAVAQKQRTIVERKQQFLQSRKHFLSRGIPPSEKLKQIAQDGNVPLSLLKVALAKVDRDLKRHSRSVYSRQMMDHVVEQIDQYYWETGTRGADGEGTSDSATEAVDDEHTVYQSDDLTLDANIAKLTPRWDTSADPASDPDVDVVDQDDYQDALTRLQDLSAKRLTLQQKLNTYKTLLTLLEPYKNAKESVQPNMVWKESPLAPELARMRTLAIRVSGRIEERLGDNLVDGNTVEDIEGDVHMDHDGGKKKVEKLLASW